ncbi:DUF1653 domain-containing protein [Patescibacteria group bacterium]|nr:DUF1653 domain-containing protein [Patescibacteria group bacterium]
MEIIPGQVWKHYKGNDYKIIILGKHSETAEDMVVYEQLHSGKIYIRPMNLFFNTVEWEGQQVPRFVKVSDN